MSAPDYARILRANLRTLRAAHGLSQQQLAAAVGVCSAMVWRWEVGRSQPRIGQLLALGRVLGVSLEALVTPGAAPQTRPRQSAPSPPCPA